MTGNDMTGWDPAADDPTDYDLRHHGDAEASEGLLDFAVNVRLPAPPPWLRAVLVDALGDLGRYPDPTAAGAAVASRHGRPVDEVLLTAGAAEAFALVARALRPRRAVCIHPSFTEPEAALRAAGHPVERVLLPPPYTLRPELVPADADLVVIGNPTNPTGVLHDPEQVLSLARPHRLLVIDEAFIDTVPGERGSVLGQRMLDGVLVLRSLTKTWGLAGLRAGYALGPASLVEALTAAQPLWPVSSLALAALQACASEPALTEADEAARQLTQHRDYLLRLLGDRPELRVAAASSTSFLLLRATEASRLRREARARGVAVRRGDTFPGLGPDYLRVAVRAPALSDVLVRALVPTPARAATA